MDFPEEIFDKIVDFNNREYDGWNILTVQEMKDFVNIVETVGNSQLYYDFSNADITFEELNEKYDMNIISEYDIFINETVKNVKDCVLLAAQDLWDTIFSRSFDAVKTLDQNEKLRDYVHYMLECARKFKDLRQFPTSEIKKIRAIYNLHTFVYNDKKVKAEQKTVKKDTNVVSTARPLSDRKRPSIK